MTIITATKKIALGLAMTATALTMATAPTTASAMSQKLGGVVGCNASGGKQEVGAVIGGVLGAVAGNKLAKHDRGTGTAIGAVVGAGAGSYAGCQMQKSRAAENAGGAYTSNGIRVANAVEAAPMTKIKGKYVARSTLNLRASASTRGERIGSVQAGETFQALGRTGDGKWILVGQDGVGVGYVSSAYVYRA
ncbi:SH3 domain-containing protein [Caulobacter sp. UNC279MFTsu5.1]|uniref:SH3 domain-containing protein n=1 Tax=Caulobacter sp. UNC279MFTsu5.1 TaxID=1502775 RepID=UPI00035CA3BA|nr:SH3 domain-containing protein [Caulobacter sp. UNC279MFTsu5.1]SFI91858.1 Glycine zipper 2TM domain-containing protein [Caulobacter sp. UNC279MFTsu5.1]